MHIGKAPQFGAGTPCRQIIEREMDHHGRRAGTELGEPLRRCRRAGTRLSEQHARMKIGDHRAARVDPFAASEDDALGHAAFGRDSLHRRTEPHLAAGRGDGAHQSGHDDVRAAAPERHAEGSDPPSTSRYGNNAPPAPSGEKSRCMPQVAIMVLSFALRNSRSSHSRGEATSMRTVSASHAVPRARHARKDRAQRLP